MTALNWLLVCFKKPREWSGRWSGSQVEDELQSDDGNAFEWQDESTEIQVTVTSFSQKGVGSRPQIIAKPKSQHGSNKEAIAAAHEELSAELLTGVLSKLRGMVTVMTTDGHVIYQNAASIAGMGNLQRHTPKPAGFLRARRLGAADTDDAMQRIFQAAPDKLEEMQEAIEAGKDWQGLIPAYAPPLPLGISPLQITNPTWCSSSSSKVDPGPSRPRSKQPPAKSGSSGSSAAKRDKLKGSNSSKALDAVSAIRAAAKCSLTMPHSPFAAALQQGAGASLHNALLADSCLSPMGEHSQAMQLLCAATGHINSSIRRVSSNDTVPPQSPGPGGHHRGTRSNASTLGGASVSSGRIRSRRPSLLGLAMLHALRTSQDELELPAPITDHRHQQQHHHHASRHSSSSYPVGVGPFDDPSAGAAGAAGPGAAYMLPPLPGRHRSRRRSMLSDLRRSTSSHPSESTTLHTQVSDPSTADYHRRTTSSTLVLDLDDTWDPAAHVPSLRTRQLAVAIANSNCGQDPAAGCGVGIGGSSGGGTSSGGASSSSPTSSGQLSVLRRTFSPGCIRRKSLLSHASGSWEEAVAAVAASAAETSGETSGAASAQTSDGGAAAALSVSGAAGMEVGDAGAGSEGCAGAAAVAKTAVPEEAAAANVQAAAEAATAEARPPPTPEAAGHSGVTGLARRVTAGTTLGGVPSSGQQAAPASPDQPTTTSEPPSPTGSDTASPSSKQQQQHKRDITARLLDARRATWEQRWRQNNPNDPHSHGGQRRWRTRASTDYSQQADDIRKAGAEAASAGSDAAQAWHDVSVSRLAEPGSGRQLLLVVQREISQTVELIGALQELVVAQHSLLESIFPRHVIEYMALAAAEPAQQEQQEGGAPGAALQERLHLARWHPEVTILFADIVGFTDMCRQVSPGEVMAFLNKLYSRLDTLLDTHEVYKVETIGDCYMVAGGLVQRDEEGCRAVMPSDQVDSLHAARVMAFAKAMLQEAAQVTLPSTGQPVQLRVGLHSGPVMSGIVGSQMPRFCLFGDTVNTASRMESSSSAGCVHASASCQQLLQDEAWQPTGGVQVKGKGWMDTFLWKP